MLLHLTLQTDNHKIIFQTELQIKKSRHKNGGFQKNNSKYLKPLN